MRFTKHAILRLKERYGIYKHEDLLNILSIAKNKNAYKTAEKNHRIIKYKGRKIFLVVKRDAIITVTLSYQDYVDKSEGAKNED